MSDTSETLHVRYQDHDSAITFAPYTDVDDGGWRTSCVAGSLVPSIGFRDGKRQNECSGESARQTTASGSTATFKFFGRAVTLYGDAQSSQYSVQIDGQDVQFGRDAGAGVVASVTGLATKEHTLRLVVSKPSPRFSFDRAEFDAALAGNRAASVFLSTDSRWTYSAGSSWHRSDNTWPGQSKSNQTMSMTWHTGETATIKFYGQAVYLFGVRAGDHSMYEVRLDGVRHGPYDGESKVLTVPRALLFYGGGLDPNAEHTLALTNLADKGLDFENAIAITSDQVPQSLTPNAPDAPTSPSTTSSVAPSDPFPSGNADPANTGSDESGATAGQTHTGGGSSTAHSLVSGETPPPSGSGPGTLIESSSVSNPAAASITDGGGNKTESASPIPLIIGSALGSAALVLIICLGIMFILRRRRRRRHQHESVVSSKGPGVRSMSHLFLPDDTSSAFEPSRASSSYVTTTSGQIVAEALPPYSAPREGAAMSAPPTGKRRR